MTKRKIQHQLEDTSRYKFGLALPPQWVLRDKEKDYGIDTEVEIFDSKELATGLVYWVQLKATRSKKDSIIKSIDLRIESIKYYKRLDIPVLLVRYSSELDAFYTKWAHEVDTYYAKKGAKKMRIKFTDSDKWNENTASNIEKYLTKVRAVKAGAISLPIPFNITFGADSVCGKSTSVLQSRLRSELNKYIDVLKIEPIKDKSLVDVYIDNNILKIGILGLAGCTFHSVDMMDKSTLEAGLIKDILLGVAVGIFQLGFNDLSSRIIFTKNIAERLKTKPEIMQYVLPRLLETSYFEEALELVGNILDNKSNDLLEIFADSAVLFARTRGNEKKSKAIENYLIRKVERYKDIDPVLYGISLYNLGNFYRSIGSHKKAARCYLKARRHEPNYCDREYYYGELAGSLFEIERYKYSAVFYKRAIDFDGVKEWRPQYADALMFNGEYQKALEVFNNYLSETNDKSAEWQLKAICLESMIGMDGTKCQVRKKDEALSLADVRKQSDENIESKLKGSLGLDMLCGLAWYNFGQLNYKRGMVNDTSFCFTVCALVQPWDIEAWVNATLSSFNKILPLSIFVLIVQAAYYRNREEYIGALYEFINKHAGSDALNEISSVVEEIISKEENVASMPELRFLNKDGIYENILEVEEA